MRLLRWLAISFVPALIGVPFTAPEYYQRLNKPEWAPPPSLFGPVWSALYALMGVAAWLVARTDSRGSSTPLTLWRTQLALNAAWTPIFFGLRAPGVALVNIVLIWAALVATVVAFFARNRPAGVLLLPYLGWVTFATALNFSIWRRNQGREGRR